MLDWRNCESGPLLVTGLFKFLAPCKKDYIAYEWLQRVQYIIWREAVRHLA